MYNFYHRNYFDSLVPTPFFDYVVSRTVDFNGREDYADTAIACNSGNATTGNMGYDSFTSGKIGKRNTDM